MKKRQDQTHIKAYVDKETKKIIQEEAESRNISYSKFIVNCVLKEIVKK